MTNEPLFRSSNFPASHRVSIQLQSTDPPATPQFTISLPGYSPSFLAVLFRLQRLLPTTIRPPRRAPISDLHRFPENFSKPSVMNCKGQPASPTTLGKEIAVRLSQERRYLSETKIKGKFAGAVGNCNAHISAYSDIDWPHVAEEFVTSLGLTFNPYVTQIEPHEYTWPDFLTQLANSTIS